MPAALAKPGSPCYTGMRLAARAGAMVASLILTGCAALSPTPDNAVPVAAEFCHNALLEQLGPGTYATHTVYYRPDAQPYFAFNRVLAEFSPGELDRAGLRDWQAALVAHSWQQQEQLEKVYLGAASDHSRRCLVEVAMNTSADTWQRYAETARTHDHYREWQRWVGLYPLASWFVERRIRAEQASWREDYGGPFTGHSVLYYPSAPTGANHASLADQHRRWLAEAYRDSPLGIPRLHQTRLNALLARHAPQIAVQQASDADRLSGIVNTAGRVHTDAESPTLYTSTQYARWQGEYLLQLSYSFWFPERPKSHAIDLYGGAWDGLTWRVTLDQSGSPLVYESLHNCGCYHQVWLPEGLAPNPATKGERPLFLPIDWKGRPRLTLLSGTHYVRHADAVKSAPSITIRERQPYRRSGYRTLLAIEDDTGKQPDFQRLFAPDGLLYESARLERLVLWPFGIPSPGAMRQLGSHAIAFVGRRHFDDPGLLEALIVPDDPASVAR